MSTGLLAMACEHKTQYDPMAERAKVMDAKVLRAKAPAPAPSASAQPSSGVTASTGATPAANAVDFLRDKLSKARDSRNGENPGEVRIEERGVLAKTNQPCLAVLVAGSEKRGDADVQFIQAQVCAADDSATTCPNDAPSMMVYRNQPANEVGFDAGKGVLWLMAGAPPVAPAAPATDDFAGTAIAQPQSQASPKPQATNPNPPTRALKFVFEGDPGELKALGIKTSAAASSYTKCVMSK